MWADAENFLLGEKTRFSCRTEVKFVGVLLAAINISVVVPGILGVSIRGSMKKASSFNVDHKRIRNTLVVNCLHDCRRSLSRSCLVTSRSVSFSLVMSRYFALRQGECLQV